MHHGTGAQKINDHRGLGPQDAAIRNPLSSKELRGYNSIQAITDIPPNTEITMDYQPGGAFGRDGEARPTHTTANYWDHKFTEPDTDIPDAALNSPPNPSDYLDWGCLGMLRNIRYMAAAVNQEKDLAFQRQLWEHRTTPHPTPTTQPQGLLASSNLLGICWAPLLISNDIVTN